MAPSVSAAMSAIAPLSVIQAKYCGRIHGLLSREHGHSARCSEQKRTGTPLGLWRKRWYRYHGERCFSGAPPLP